MSSSRADERSAELGDDSCGRGNGGELSSMYSNVYVVGGRTPVQDAGIVGGDSDVVVDGAWMDEGNSGG